MKKTISLFIIGAATVLTPLNSPNVFAQTTSQVSNLTQADVPLVIPKYLPKGFRLTNFEVKKIIALFNTGVFSLLMLLTSPRAIAQTAVEVRQMREVGVPVVMPQYVPNGFRLTFFRTTLYGRGMNSYAATYEGPNSCAFDITGADGGWGAGGVTVRKWIINTKLFGKIVLEGLSFDSSSNPTYLYVEILHHRLNRKPLKNYPNAGYLASFNCRNRLFSPQEANKIIHSFRLR